MQLSPDIPHDRDHSAGARDRRREREHHFESLYIRSWREMRARSKEPALND